MSKENLIQLYLWPWILRHLQLVVTILAFEQIFSRTLEGIGNKGDSLIVISTSGNSKNILRVLKEAKKKKNFFNRFFRK